MMTDPDFWNDQTKAQDIIDKNNALKSIVNGYYQLTNAVDDMSATRELLQEEYDEDMKIELEEEVQQFEEQIDQYELQLLLDGPHDANNAILELHPGAGGTESQDWVSMLLGCINVTVNKMALKLKRLIIFQEMKQALKVSHYLLKDIMLMVI